MWALLFLEWLIRSSLIATIILIVAPLTLLAIATLARLAVTTLALLTITAFTLLAITTLTRLAVATTTLLIAIRRTIAVIATLTLLTITILTGLVATTLTIVVGMWAIATSLRSAVVAALQSCTESLRTEAALIIISRVKTRTLIGWTLSGMNSWTR